MVNNKIENDDLRVFVAVARKSSFAAAATELGMSPAYIGKRIGILEATLGIRLFHRITRRVVVSEEGEQVFVRAQGILAGLDSLFDDVAERQDANVWAVYPQRLASSAKVRVCVDFLERHLACDNRAFTNA